MAGHFPAIYPIYTRKCEKIMRAPRLSLSEEFRDVWDKENKNPVTAEFSPRTSRRVLDTALKDITLLREIDSEDKRQPSSSSTRNTWLDTLLNL